MGLMLSDILRSIIEEDSSKDINSYDINSYDIDTKIKYAITNKKYISLYYDDKKGKEKLKGSKGNPKGFRRVIPYCYGSRKGRPALRAFHCFHTNTKRGPFKWKFFYVDNIKNLNVYEKFPSFSQKNVPQNFNPDGDMHMDEVYAIVDFNYTSPLYNAKNEFEKKNKRGSIKNLNSLTNLTQYRDPTTVFKNGKTNYGAVKANMQKRDLNMTTNDKEDYWKDYDKAKEEAEMNTNGPINSYDENGYDVNDVDFDENNFIRDTNRR